MKDLFKYFVVAFSALLPLVNPPGSALELLSIVRSQPQAIYKRLALKIAINMALLFAAFALGGSYILSFFGISVHILQVAGGAVVVALAWCLLNQPEPEAVATDDKIERESIEESQKHWESRTFYPLTFPVTVGPGGVAVMITLGAQARARDFGSDLNAYAGLMLAVVVLSAMVYACYAYAPYLARKVSSTTVHGILRLMAFLMLCIGAQIAWNGLSPLLAATHDPAVTQAQH
jgi:multiple antibiotic resistance protein